MNTLLQTLRDEHQVILKMFNEKQNILDIITYLETVHHPREEQELFPLVAAHPMLSQGGPLCTYFRGLELDLAPFDSVKNYLKRLYAQGFPRSSLYASFDWLTPGNPLNIPMGEHDLGHEIGEALKYLSLPGHSEQYPGAFPKLSEEYEALLRAHIDKEDRCLFIMCEKLLGASPTPPRQSI